MSLYGVMVFKRPGVKELKEGSSLETGVISLHLMVQSWIEKARVSD